MIITVMEYLLDFIQDTWALDYSNWNLGTPRSNIDWYLEILGPIIETPMNEIFNDWLPNSICFSVGTEEMKSSFLKTK